MTTAQTYHGKGCTLTVKTAAGSSMVDNTSTAINAMGFSVRLEFTVAELETQDSILRASDVRTYVNVPVTLSYVKNDALLLATIMGTIDADQDVDGSVNAGTSRASITDSITNPLFDMWGIATRGSDVIKVLAEDISFTSFPLLDAPMNDWCKVDLTGSAKQAYVQYDT